jgi:hypothetical protein
MDTMEAIADAIYSEPLLVRRAIDGLVRLGVLCGDTGLWRCAEHLPHGIAEADGQARCRG